MIDNENRKLAAIALGRALIAAAGTHPFPNAPTSANARRTW